MQVVSLELHKR